MEIYVTWKDGVHLIAESGSIYKVGIIITIYSRFYLDDDLENDLYKEIFTFNDNNNGSSYSMATCIGNRLDHTDSPFSVTITEQGLVIIRPLGCTIAKNATLCFSITYISAK